MQTLSGTTVGTPQYMAPELFLGENYDGKVDQYALAITIYEMLSGQIPFHGPTPAAIALQQMNHAPRPLVELVPGVSATVSNAVQKALSKDPRRRYPDCRSFMDALRTSSRTMPVIPRSASRSRKTALAPEPLPPIAAPVAPPPMPTPGGTVYELPATDAPCPSCGALCHLPATLSPGKNLALSELQGRLPGAASEVYGARHRPRSSRRPRLSPSTNDRALRAIPCRRCRSRARAIRSC